MEHLRLVLVSRTARASSVATTVVAVHAACASRRRRTVSREPARLHVLQTAPASPAVTMAAGVRVARVSPANNATPANARPEERVAMASAARPKARLSVRKTAVHRGRSAMPPARPRIGVASKGCVPHKAQSASQLQTLIARGRSCRSHWTSSINRVSRTPIKWSQAVVGAG